MEQPNNKQDVLLDYTFVLDASGSMRSDIPEVLEEVNKQIRELKEKFEETQRPCRVTIIRFDSDLVVLRDGERIQNLEELTAVDYFSGGMTALYDAFGVSVKRADARVDYLVKRGEAEALVVVFTDGGENASKEFSAEGVRQLFLDYQERDGWTIALIGTDFDAMEDMERRHMDRKKMRSYTQKEKRRAVSNLSASVSDYYSVKDASFSLSKERYMEEQNSRKK